MALVGGLLLDGISIEATFIGIVVLGAACAVCSVTPGNHDVMLGIGLFLLGVGWNFCFVGGSTLLSDQLSPAERSRTQGTNDLFVGLASASISLGSGFLFGAIGYAGITAIAGGLAIIPLVMSVNFMRTSRVAAVA